MKYRGVETWCEKYQCKHKLHDASEFEIKIDFCRFDWFVLVTSIKVSFNHKLSTKIVKLQNHYFVSIKTFKLAVDLYRVDDYHLTVISYMKSPLNLKSKHCYLDDSYSMNHIAWMDPEFINYKKNECDATKLLWQRWVSFEQLVKITFSESWKTSTTLELSFQSHSK